MRPRLLVAFLIVGCGSAGDDGATATVASSGSGGSATSGSVHSSSSSGGAGCENTLLPDGVLPQKLSATGLYQDIATGTIHPALRSFAPRYALWSDAAEKQRWIYLPECEPIDSSDMNDWSLPVGTRLFKEFVVEGKRIETRLIERFGPGPNDFGFAAYLWDEAQKDATRVPLGAANANGTTHDVPSESDCRRCHGSHEKKGGRPSRALGFSALQLSHEDSATTLGTLAALGKLSHAPARAFAAPGDEVAALALGTLHANCGHCHNGTADRIPQIDLNLWLDVEHTSVEITSAYLTAVGKPTQIFHDQHTTLRIVPGKPEQSAVVYRMRQRGNNAQMPPLASETVDEAGLVGLSAWIATLP